MESCQIVIVTRSKELPAIECKDFFHSTELFHILEQTPGSTPYMVIAKDAHDVVHAHLLAVVNRRGSMLPPYLYSVGRIYGEGEYVDEAEKPQLFSQMLRAITTRLKRRLCLYIEVSHISKKMFGYRTFRENDYFPIRWMQVHNSLHSKAPEERLDEKMKSLPHLYGEFQEVDYRWLRRGLFARQCLPVVYGHEEKVVCQMPSHDDDHLECLARLIQTRFSTSSFHECGFALQ